MRKKPADDEIKVITVNTEKELAQYFDQFQKNLVDLTLNIINSIENVINYPKIIHIQQIDADWSKRLNNLKQFQGLILGECYKMPSFDSYLQSIIPHMIAQVNDLRSAIQKEACKSLVLASERMGNQFENTAVKLFKWDGLLHLLGNGKKILADTAHECIEKIISNVHSSQFFQVISDEINSKNINVRTRLTGYLGQMLREYENKYKEKNLNLIEQVIIKTCKDANQEVRANSRFAYNSLKIEYPELSDIIYQQFDNTTKKLVQSNTSYIHDASAMSGSSSVNRLPSSKRSLSTIVPTSSKSLRQSILKDDKNGKQQQLSVDQGKQRSMTIVQAQPKTTASKNVRIVENRTSSLGGLKGVGTAKSGYGSRVSATSVSSSPGKTSIKNETNQKKEVQNGLTTDERSSVFKKTSMKAHQNRMEDIKVNDFSIDENQEFNIESLKNHEAKQIAFFSNNTSSGIPGDNNGSLGSIQPIVNLISNQLSLNNAHSNPALSNNAQSNNAISNNTSSNSQFFKNNILTNDGNAINQDSVFKKFQDDDLLLVTKESDHSSEGRVLEQAIYEDNSEDKQSSEQQNSIEINKYIHSRGNNIQSDELSFQGELKLAIAAPIANQNSIKYTNNILVSQLETPTAKFTPTISPKFDFFSNQNAVVEFDLQHEDLLLDQLNELNDHSLENPKFLSQNFLHDDDYSQSQIQQEIRMLTKEATPTASQFDPKNTSNFMGSQILNLEKIMQTQSNSQNLNPGTGRSNNSPETQKISQEKTSNLVKGTSKTENKEKKESSVAPKAKTTTTTITKVATTSLKKDIQPKISSLTAQKDTPTKYNQTNETVRKTSIPLPTNTQKIAVKKVENKVEELDDEQKLEKELMELTQRQNNKKLSTSPIKSSGTGYSARTSEKSLTKKVEEKKTVTPSRTPQRTVTSVSSKSPNISISSKKEEQSPLKAKVDDKLKRSITPSTVSQNSKTKNLSLNLRQTAQKSSMGNINSSSLAQSEASTSRVNISNKPSLSDLKVSTDSRSKKSEGRVSDIIKQQKAQSISAPKNQSNDRMELNIKYKQSEDYNQMQEFEQIGLKEEQIKKGSKYLDNEFLLKQQQQFQQQGYLQSYKQQQEEYQQGINQEQQEDNIHGFIPTINKNNYAINIIENPSYSPSNSQNTYQENLSIDKKELRLSSKLSSIHMDSKQLDNETMEGLTSKSMKNHLLLNQFKSVESYNTIQATQVSSKDSQEMDMSSKMQQLLSTKSQKSEGRTSQQFYLSNQDGSNSSKKGNQSARNYNETLQNSLSTFAKSEQKNNLQFINNSQTQSTQNEKSPNNSKVQKTNKINNFEQTNLQVQQQIQQQGPYINLNNSNFNNNPNQQQKQVESVRKQNQIQNITNSPKNKSNTPKNTVNTPNSNKFMGQSPILTSFQSQNNNLCLNLMSPKNINNNQLNNIFLQETNNVMTNSQQQSQKQQNQDSQQLQSQNDSNQYLQQKSSKGQQQLQLEQQLIYEQKLILEKQKQQHMEDLLKQKEQQYQQLQQQMLEQQQKLFEQQTQKFQQQMIEQQQKQLEQQQQFQLERQSQQQKYEQLQLQLSQQQQSQVQLQQQQLQYKQEIEQQQLQSQQQQIKQQQIQQQQQQQLEQQVQQYKQLLLQQQQLQQQSQQSPSQKQPQLQIQQQQLQQQIQSLQQQISQQQLQIQQQQQLQQQNQIQQNQLQLQEQPQLQQQEQLQLKQQQQSQQKQSSPFNKQLMLDNLNNNSIQQLNKISALNPNNNLHINKSSIQMNSQQNFETYLPPPSTANLPTMNQIMNEQFSVNNNNLLNNNSNKPLSPQSIQSAFFLNAQSISNPLIPNSSRNHIHKNSQDLPQFNTQTFNNSLNNTRNRQQPESVHKRINSDFFNQFNSENEDFYQRQNYFIQQQQQQLLQQKELKQYYDGLLEAQYEKLQKGIQEQFEKSLNMISDKICQTNHSQRLSEEMRSPSDNEKQREKSKNNDEKKKSKNKRTKESKESENDSFASQTDSQANFNMNKFLGNLTNRNKSQQITSQNNNTYKQQEYQRQNWHQQSKSQQTYSQNQVVSDQFLKEDKLKIEELELQLTPLQIIKVEIKKLKSLNWATKLDSFQKINAALEEFEPIDDLQLIKNLIETTIFILTNEQHQQIIEQALISAQYQIKLFTDHFTFYLDSAIQILLRYQSNKKQSVSLQSEQIIKLITESYSIHDYLGIFLSYALNEKFLENKLAIIQIIFPILRRNQIYLHDAAIIQQIVPVISTLILQNQEIKQIQMSCFAILNYLIEFGRDICIESLVRFNQINNDDLVSFRFLACIYSPQIESSMREYTQFNCLMNYTGNDITYNISLMTNQNHYQKQSPIRIIPTSESLQMRSMRKDGTIKKQKTRQCKTEESTISYQRNRNSLEQVEFLIDNFDANEQIIQDNINEIVTLLTKSITEDNSQQQKQYSLQILEKLFQKQVTLHSLNKTSIKKILTLYYYYPDKQMEFFALEEIVNDLEYIQPTSKLIIQALIEKIAEKTQTYKQGIAKAHFIKLLTNLIQNEKNYNSALENMEIISKILRKVLDNQDQEELQANKITSKKAIKCLTYLYFCDQNEMNQYWALFKVEQQKLIANKIKEMSQKI